MVFTAKTTYNLKRILPFGLIWLVIAWLLMWTEYAVMQDETKALESAIPLSSTILVFASVSVFLVGFLVGALEVFYINKRFANFSFPFKIIGKFFLYSFILSILVLILYMMAASLVSKSPVFSKSVWDQYVVFFFSITHISTAIQLLFSLLVSLLYAEISENLGQNVLVNFFTGKYHKPVAETRIFLFSDMKSSTSIAEALGHANYFQLLRSYYRDLSNAILRNQGEVYQYIGDEIVISWKLEKGLKNKQALRCFFDMKRDLSKKKDAYVAKYGFFPDFKAGLHYGEVTTGEIGALKKEIFFTGDVLNTTARIQSLCSEHGVDLLLSQKMVNAFNLGETFKVKSIGDTMLKGKTEKLDVVAVTM